MLTETKNIFEPLYQALSEKNYKAADFWSARLLAQPNLSSEERKVLFELSETIYVYTKLEKGVDLTNFIST